MLLDGGFDAWTGAGRKETDVVPPARTGTLSALKIQPVVVNADYVAGHLKDPNVAIVDARTSAFYDGVQTGGAHDVPHKTGHIAGARSIPFSSLVDERNQFRSAGELRAVFTKAGVKAGDTIVAYCHIGQQATVVVFAARTLGHRALLYDASFEDWSRRADRPVENPSKKDRR